MEGKEILRISSRSTGSLLPEHSSPQPVENAMNHFTLSGHLASDPKLEPGETPSTRLRIVSKSRDLAADCFGGGLIDSEWFWILGFGELAEAASGQLRRGDELIVSGHLRADLVDDRGQDRELVRLVASDIRLLHEVTIRRSESELASTDVRNLDRRQVA